MKRAAVSKAGILEQAEDACDLPLAHWPGRSRERLIALYTKIGEK